MPLTNPTLWLLSCILFLVAAAPNALSAGGNGGSETDQQPNKVYCGNLGSILISGGKPWKAVPDAFRFTINLVDYENLAKREVTVVTLNGLLLTVDKQGQKKQGEKFIAPQGEEVAGIVKLQDGTNSGSITIAAYKPKDKKCSLSLEFKK